MLIIEGADNSGKSTLVKQFESLMPGQKILHSGGPVKSVEDRDQRMKNIFNSRHTIWDRVPCVSEQIYGPIMRGENIFEGTTYLEDLILMGPVIVFCRPPDNRLLDLSTHHINPNHDTQKHMSDVERHHERIVEGYDRMMRTIPHLRYDYYTMSMDHRALFLSHIVMLHRLHEEKRREPVNER